jgi:N,N'-diacetyllegionaminate synthase
MTRVRIGDQWVGAGHPALLVAEIGINHNGDLALAREAIAAAADAGASAVKFQNYHTEDFVRNRDLTLTYRSSGRVVTEAQYDLFKRCELERDALAALRDMCAARGVLFHATPTSECGIADLIALGAPVLKNGSDYLAHLPLIAALGKSQRPVVLSVGMATLAEIDRAVTAFRATGNRDLVLLHCTSSYPTAVEDVNLRRIPALGKAFGCPVGFSDHSEGITAALGAVALGACWVEKHFTVDRGLPGPDHAFSADPAEFAALVTAVRQLERQLGNAHIAPTAGETENRAAFRLSCIAARDLPAGTVLTEDDIVFARPGTGLPPEDVERILGRTLACAVTGGDPIAWERVR